MLLFMQTAAVGAGTPFYEYYYRHLLAGAS